MAAQEHEVYEYVAVATGSRVQLDESKGQIVLDGHSVLHAEKCGTGSGYRCLVSDGGAFVFPWGAISEQSAWEYKQHEFKVLRKIRGRLFGRAYSGFLVRSRQGVDEYWYLFSPTHGLLAFGAQNKTAASTFVLEGICGFASAEKCKRHRGQTNNP